MPHTQLNSDAVPPNSTAPSAVEWLRQTAPALFWTGVLMLLASFITLALIQFDSRLLQGVSVWLKPWKFQLSTGVYLLSLLIFMAWLPRSALQSRVIGYVIWVAVLTGIFEVIYITWQAAHGQASHFNWTTPRAATMYTLMGVGAVLLTSAAPVLAMVIARSKEYGLSPTLKLAIVLGLWLTFALGAGFGGYLGGQRTGHWVGTAATDAGGLPMLAWSRTGGDLRVAHFFGIHAMHFIPFFAYLLHHLRMPQAPARALVWVFSALFCALCLFTFFQARRGQPFWA